MSSTVGSFKRALLFVVFFNMRATGLVMATTAPPPSPPALLLALLIALININILYVAALAYFG